MPWHALPVATAALLLVVASNAIAMLTPGGPGYAIAAFLGFLPVVAMVNRLAPHQPRGLSFGAANWTTLMRGVLAGLAAGLVAAPETLSGRPAHAWLPVVLVVAGLLFDLMDGRLARRHNRVSEFGARFDMAVDAWTTLVLAVVVAALGAAPVWILALGLLSYAFRAAGWIHPALAAPLPPSLRRRLTGGTQTLVLGVLLAPPLPPAAATTIAALTLLAVGLSFAIDVCWLWRNRA